MLVIAPPGVTTNWTVDEVPNHLPDDVPVLSHAYVTQSAKTKWHRNEIQALLAFEGLSFLAMSYNAFMTNEGRRTAESFFARRKVFYVLDESHRIKNPGAKRTKSIVATGRRTPYKRILTGTPVTNKPFDCYSQIKFLNEEFWKTRGFASYEAFKVYFGNWEQRINGATGQRFNTVVSFKNLEQLCRMVAEISSRVTKAEVLDLPAKVYQKRYFDLSEAQKTAYAQLRDEFLLFLESGETVTAALVIVRLLRLQQITCGYLPVDSVDGGPARLDRFPENPRLDELMDLLEDVEGKAIIFARFRADVDQVMEKLGTDAVRYDGAVDDEGRLEARQRFQDPGSDVRYFVGNPAVAGVGLTLHAASTVVYYSNSFDLEQRLQSEDRAHRIGTKKTVNYIDLIAKGTVDAKIVRALREKLNIASQITGDSAKEWL
jgi:SNF2 family DNA or RNA helicase